MVEIESVSSEKNDRIGDPSVSKNMKLRPRKVDTGIKSEASMDSSPKLSMNKKQDILNDRLKQDSTMIPVKLPTHDELEEMKKDRKAKNQFHQQAILYGVDMLSMEQDFFKKLPT